MECNKDEATRAKQIAEKKFGAKDIAGAKKFALKAQNLYPDLEGLPQMLSTLDVYLSAEKKICGEPDWYGILGVEPFSDDETVRKQYRKLALMHHPDKNKSIGADGAFKLISEAWSLLSDKSKRATYDQKRIPKNPQTRFPTTVGGPSVPAANGFNGTLGARAHKTTPHVGPTTAPAPAPAPAPRPPKSKTFWTSCNHCKMQYEYLRMYQNHKLLCPNCHEPFLAIETPTPSKIANSSSSWSFSQKHQNTNHHRTFTGDHGSFNRTDSQWGSASAGGNATASAQGSGNTAQQVYDRARRAHQEAQAALRRQEALQRKHPTSKRPASSAEFSNAASGFDLKGERPVKRTRGLDDGGVSGYGGSMFNHIGSENGGGFSSGSTSGFRQGGFEMGRVNELNGTRDLTQAELRNMLMEKAKREIRKKLNEWSSDLAAKTSKKEKEKETDKMKQKEPPVVNGLAHTLKKSVELNPKKVVQKMQDSLDSSGVDSDSEAHEPLSINVPDPDFHDFDNDRSERSFGDNQVWAAYDNDDGMPRYYAMIQKVISLKPFKMRIGWLNSKSNSELGPIDWVGSGFAKTCGDFRVGRYEVNNSLNSFSHRVKWAKGGRGAIRVLPTKGDIWALYRNWSPDWNESTPDEVIHKYDMVEVLDDYHEEQGVTVTPLVKVNGFKTVFHRHEDPTQSKRIPREEMFRFSHQVPSHLLTGEEAQNAPKGCRELDPAATPLELLQVIAEAKEEETLTCSSKDLRKEPNGEAAENTEMQVETEPREENIAESVEEKTSTVEEKNCR